MRFIPPHIKYYVASIGLAMIAFSPSYTQEIELISAEQKGENIIIHYQIPRSLEGEAYFVQIWCRNGTEEIKVKSASGDIGKQVPGGKSEYQVVWDVLKDVEELGNARFIVRAEKTGHVKSAGSAEVSEEKPSSPKTWTGMLQYYGGLQNTPFGMQFHMIKKMGFFAAIRFGDGTYTDHLGEFDIIFTAMTAGLSASLPASANFSMVPFVGGGYGIWGLYNHEVFEKAHDSGAQIDYGLMLKWKRVTTTIGGSHLFGDEFHSNLLIGIGYVIF